MNIYSHKIYIYIYIYIFFLPYYLVLSFYLRRYILYLKIWGTTKPQPPRIVGPPPEFHPNFQP